jgi:hypothetical protein
MGTIWMRRAAFVVGLLLCGPAWATTVEVVKGVVSVKQGEGFRQIAGPTQVYTGDKVMTAPGGQARIVYPNGCLVQIGSGGLATVGECKEPMTAGLDTPEPCDPNDPKALCAAAAPHGPYWLYAGIAVGIGVGICAASGCFEHEHHHPPPRSP